MDNDRSLTLDRRISPSTERSGSGEQSQLAPQNVDGTTRERLQRLAGRDHQSLGPLASLLEEYHTAWHGSSAFDKLSEGAEADFFLFEENKTRTWIDGMCSSMKPGLVDILAYST